MCLLTPLAGWSAYPEPFERTVPYKATKKIVVYQQLVNASWVWSCSWEVVFIELNTVVCILHSILGLFLFLLTLLGAIVRVSAREVVFSVSTQIGVTSPGQWLPEMQPPLHQPCWGREGAEAALQGDLGEELPLRLFVLLPWFLLHEMIPVLMFPLSRDIHRPGFLQQGMLVPAREEPRASCEIPL